MKCPLPAVVFLTVLPVIATAQPALQTRPERTGYEETSRYEDVVAFIEKAAAASPRLFATHYGYTVEGRQMPLVVVGNVENASPDAVRKTGKVRVLLQGNIHAGEVEGKEALLELLRALAAGAHSNWTDSLVLLITPIYNADGNERIGLYNRPFQHGPFGGMGQRPNAQGFDLNRDHMKLASPEGRNFVRLLADYDPHVVVDLHTTDGSFHGYHLTYAPGLNPNTPATITRLLRDEWLPTVTQKIKARDGWDLYYYGNFDGFQQRPQQDSAGWYTFDHRPRFNNNYVGLRNRVAILSEAYSYLPFEARIAATRRFVEEVLDFAAGNATHIARLVAQADDESIVGQPVAVRSKLAPPDTAVILVGDVRTERNPYSGAPLYLRDGPAVPTPMLEYGTFEPDVVVTAPAAYLIPETAQKVLETLRFHGITVAPATGGEQRVEVFQIDSVQVAERVFQGQREQTVYGSYAAQTRVVAAGMQQVRVTGPLARLIVYLLEPRSDDGLVNWAVFGEALQSGGEYPLWRVPGTPGN